MRERVEGYYTPKQDFTKAWEGVKFTPIVDFTKGTVGVECDIAGRVSREIISVKEQAIRQGLQALGWVSPEDAQKMRDELAALKSL